MIEHIVQKNELQAVILSLDAEKAFDLVNWKFSYILQQEFGYHQSFIKTIQALYNSPRARPRVNGAISN